MSARLTSPNVIAHVFTFAEGPLAEAGSELVWDVWNRSRDLLHTTAPIGSLGLPTEPPAAGFRSGHTRSTPLAGAESTGGSAQLVLRAEHDVLALSVLLKHPDQTWIELDRLLRTVLGATASSVLGSAIVHVAEAEGLDHGAGFGGDLRELLPSASQAPDWWHRGGRLGNGLALWESSAVDDHRAHRELVVLARLGERHVLGNWTWSHDGRPEMPPLARYLMHLAKIRYQLRVWSRLPAAAELCRRADANELGETMTTMTAMRHTVDIAEANAVRALADLPLPDNGVDPVTDDRALASWFAQQLDDDIVYLTTFHEGALRRPASPAPRGGPRTVPGGERVLVVADEWFPRRGGLSAFNRYLCTALAAESAAVFCYLPMASDDERTDAASAGVTLVVAPKVPGGSEKVALMRKPALPAGIVPDVIIGHGRVTGPMAQCLTDDHFPNAARVHFVHMEPDEVEWQKLDREEDSGVRADDRCRAEVDLAEHASRTVAVGPRLAGWMERDLLARNSSAPRVHQFDPGFDSPDPVRRSPLPGDPQILVLGRMEDAEVKGVDIAACAVGQARRLAHVDGKWELLVRGANVGESLPLWTKINNWVSHPSIGVRIRPYSTEFARIAEDLRRASLVLMPSRAEGFGLVGLEAVVAGTPTLVSGESGLGLLLRSVLDRELAARVVVPVTKDLESDARTWSTMITSVLLNKQAAFDTAERVRTTMATARSWSSAVSALLVSVRDARRRGR
ncbi:CATRA conflict system CASPASE/TPR repeat-associated protein [Lentzea sp. BCCO 10_0061]|uniref:CATRA conflict system CASPASE/TPR repeat-associated protein n=1 Tax=Lentzea sokolovensis TaxID=3095429 RepID=A0ABU4UQ64_9PSEU|nr:CATRA conflict system CASPASE/TPR repeat-associated protein [Lentzea sp. BCCO 10_0061]MDX8141564.1 CATRA conflict system CASPASE/TPR repeat-associated protein [Lentzea sp. BCCO 10_0061]